jgi:site-specific DNA-methyltransferase (adenine-specific)
VVKGANDISGETFMESTLSIWEIPPESATQVKHPAPFPVELPKRFIQLYTFQDELVLVPFMGSGSTAVAAVLTNRHSVGYDISEQYCEVTRDRANQALASREPDDT